MVLLKSFIRQKSQPTLIDASKKEPSQSSSNGKMIKASSTGLCIEFLRGSRRDEKLELQGTWWQIGTSPSCDILFDMILDAEVNDRHAEIVLKEGHYWIVPLAASQTWLNGELLQTQQKLKHGDKLIFGVEDGPEIGVCSKTEVRPAPSPIPAVRTRIEKGNGQPHQERFRQNFTLGRGDDCDLRFDDTQVSLRHAKFVWDGSRWLVEDLQSTNGTYLNGKRIQRAALPPQATIELAHGGPVIAYDIESPEQTLVSPAPSANQAVNELAQRYFGASAPEQAGRQTVLIRQAYQQVRRQHAKRYWILIGVVFIFFTGAIGALYYQNQRVKKLEKLHATAENVFYAMKSLELQMSKLQTNIAQHPDSQLKKQFEETMQQQRQLQASYTDFARDELGISQDRLNEEEWLIYKVARIFGECDVSMPTGFVKTVREYIRRWQSTDRFRKALERALANGYAPKIAQAMLAHDMPPQFFYMALQESDFDLKRCGPRTRSGIAKGLWQFIPKTGMQYGLSSGPLLEWRRYDPRDERHDFEKSTIAAAKYLRDIYQTEAQASGLLVMACYNWGPDNVQMLLDRLPKENPRERNFWKLLSHGKIPQQTYDYVFYIVSAAVIGENPRLFGFDFNNPLKLE